MKNAETLSKTIQYKMRKGQDRRPLSELAGEEFTPEAYCRYQYINRDGEQVEGLSLLVNGDVYFTSSEAVINSFADIEDLNDDLEADDVNIVLKLVKKTSKQGREYNVLDVVI